MDMNWAMQRLSEGCRVAAALVALGSVAVAAAGADAVEEPQMKFPGLEWTVVAPETQGLVSNDVAAAMAHVASVAGEHGVSRSLVVRNGAIVWAGTDIDTLQPVWSCTKSFMSLCLGLLWDDGKCRPQDLACTSLPVLREHYPTVTLAHLATFTSGYANLGDQTFEPAPPMYTPGAAFHYSSQADLLALVLTRVANEPLRELLKRRIADPIGLPDKDWCWNVHSEVDGLTVNGGSGFPASGIHITPRAFARLGWLMANNGEWDGKRLISTNYIAEASRPQVQPTVPPHDPKAWYVDLPGSYGLNWWVNGTTPSGERMWPHAPVDMFAAQGNKNNVCFIIPSWKMVVVRMGGDAIIDMRLYDGMFARLAEAL